MSHYVSGGEINIDELLSSEKMLLIEPLIRDFTGGPITPIKEKLGRDISFSEIRWALAWKEFKKMKLT